MMSPEIKAEWIAALRSGEYQQGNERLAYKLPDEETPRFCCLGVLCELATKAGIVTRVRAAFKEERSVQEFDYVMPDDETRIHYLPSEEIGKWAGLQKPNPNVIFQGEWQPLAHLNDKLGKSFAEIADAIENSPM